MNKNKSGNRNDDKQKDNENKDKNKEDTETEKENDTERNREKENKKRYFREEPDNNETKKDNFIEYNELNEVSKTRDIEEKKKEEEKDGYRHRDKTESIEIIKADNYGLTAKFLSYLARIKNITFGFTDTYNSNFDSRIDRPVFAYQLGLPNILSAEELSRRENMYEYSVSSGLQILTNLSADYRFNYKNKLSYNSGNNRHTIEINYPDLDLSLTGVEKLLNKISFLDSLIESSNVRSNFNIYKKKEGKINSSKLDREGQTLSLSPLINWHANWVNNVSTDLSLSHSNSIDYTYSQQGTTIKKTELTQTATANISYRFSAPGGLKIPFIGDKIKFKNNLTSSLNFDYSKALNKTITETNDNDTKNSFSIKITPSISYEFNESINGGLSGNIEQTKDRDKDKTISKIGMELWVEVKF